MNRKWMVGTLVCSLLLEGCIGAHFSSQSNVTQTGTIHSTRPPVPDAIATRDRIARAMLLYAAADVMEDESSKAKSSTTIIAIFFKIFAIDELEECGFPREKAVTVLANVSTSLKTARTHADAARIVREASPPTNRLPNQTAPLRQKLLADNPPAPSKATPAPTTRPRVRTDATRGAGRVADTDHDAKVDSRLAAVLGTLLMPMSNMAGSPESLRERTFGEREEGIHIDSELGQMEARMSARTEAQERARFYAVRTEEHWQSLSPMDRQKRVQIAYSRLDKLSTELNPQEIEKVRAALARLSEPASR